MDILYFSQIRLLPAGHGNIATVHEYVRRLRMLGHRVHYVLLNESCQKGEVLFLSQSLVDTLDVIEDRARPERDERGYYVFDARYFDGLGEKVRELCLRYRVQAVICTYVFHSRILEFVPEGVLRIIDTHDRMTDRHLFLRSHAIRDEFFSCTREDEARYLSRADVIWARRDEETDFFNEITHSKKCVTVSHFDAPRYLPERQIRTRRAGFLASDNEVNFAMVKDFVRAFAARFEKEPLDVHVVIGGAVRSLFERDHVCLPQNVPVELVGRVPDIEDFYRSLDLALVPVTFGTGVNVKMVEAMSFGLPVLSTSCGIKGMASDSFWHTAGTVDELVDRLWKLWNDDAALAGLGDLSRKLYEGFFEKNVRAFDACFGRRVLPEPAREGCCGCGVCVPLCPESALRLVRDERGFFRAERLSSCTDCGICLRICPLDGPGRADGENPSAASFAPAAASGVSEENAGEAESGGEEAALPDALSPDSGRTAARVLSSAGVASGRAAEDAASVVPDAVFGGAASVSACRSADETLRRRSLTAGFLRTLVLDALPQFDGVLAPEAGEAWGTSVRLFTSEEDVLAHLTLPFPAPCEYSGAAEFLRDHEGRYLVLGLPCHTAALDRARPFLKGVFTSVDLFCEGVRSLPFLRRCAEAEEGGAPFLPGASGRGAGLFSLALRHHLFTQGACLDCVSAATGGGDVQVGAATETSWSITVARTAQGRALVESLSDVERRSRETAELYEAEAPLVENFRRASGMTDGLAPENTRAFSRALNDAVSERLDEVRDAASLESMLRPWLTGLRSARPSCLIVPPDDGCGSFGDHAMLLSLLSGMKKRRPDIVPGIFLRERRGEDGFLANMVVNVRHFGAQPGVSLLDHFAAAAAAHDHVVFMGADILDGGYGHACSLQQFAMMAKAHELSLPVDVLGFSFRETDDPVILDAVRALSSFARLHVRDAVSLERLKAAGCSNLVPVADLAFLFDENDFPCSAPVSEVLDAVHALKAQGRRPVGLHVTARRDEGYLDFFARLVRALYAVPGVVPVLLPHDSRVYADKYSDEYLLGRLAAYLERRSLPFVSAVSACPDESCVKRIVSALDLVVTSRMHLAIAAMSRSVPAVSFAYQGKFEGLYRFFDFEEPPIFRASSFRPEDLTRCAAALLSKNARPMMQRCNENIRRLAGDNFDFLESFPPAASPAGA